MKQLTKRKEAELRRRVESRLEFVKTSRFHTSPVGRDNEIKQLRKIYHKIPKAVQQVNEGRKTVVEKGLVPLDGRVVPALKARGLEEYVGAQKLATDVQVGFYGRGFGIRYDLHIFDNWWCEPWFGDFLNKVKGEKRKLFYDRISQLKDTNDKEALDAELGLMVLHAMD